MGTSTNAILAHDLDSGDGANHAGGLLKATIYRPPARPDRRWHLGLGFNDWLAHLPVADKAPTDAADEALGVAGWRRVGEWGPHRRVGWGWLVADVERLQDG